MLIGVILLALPCLVASTCDVTCDKSKTQLVKENECICSKNYGGSYPKDYYCNFRLTLNKDKRVRLVPKGTFKMRYGAGCSIDNLKFDNKYNKVKESYWMKTVCKKDQMHGDPKAIIVNTPQALMKFSSSKKGGKTKGKKWKLCLNPKRNPEIKSPTSCPAELDGFVKGYNRRSVTLTNTDSTKVTKVCCSSMGLWAKDQLKKMCVDSTTNEAGPIMDMATDGTESCMYCNSDKKQVDIELDAFSGTTPSTPNQKVSCTCVEEDGVAIGDDCTGNLPCLDSKDLAYCDTAGDNTCKCPDGYVVSYDGLYCTTNAQLTESCADGENCVSKYGRAGCDGSVCTCPPGFTAEDLSRLYRGSVPTQPRCTKAVALGEDCSGELTCIDSTNRATCQSDVCACPSGAMPSADNSYCTYDNNLNGYCDVDTDCTQARSESCNTGTNKCVCESPYVIYNSKCSYKSNIDGPCTSGSIDCVPSNSKCSGGKCVCKNDDYKKSTDKTKCNAICLMKDGTQIDEDVEICNKRFSSKCYHCKCNNPTSKMKEVKSKSKCNSMSICTKSGTIKTEVKKGSNCGE